MVSSLVFHDIDVCDVQMLHKVSAIDNDGRYQISDNHGYVNGWCTRQNVFGILVAMEN